MLGVFVSVVVVVSGAVEASRCTGFVFHDLFWYSDVLQLIDHLNNLLFKGTCVCVGVRGVTANPLSRSDGQ